ncbi:MAG: proline racemase [Planctomycetes bacterium]|nr:proline racemase [Planctomycetota bacterium]
MSGRLRIAAARDWQPSARYQRIRTIDAHTGGEPFRVVLDAPAIPGEDILAKRRFAQTRLDELRRLLMWEPRGHADMYGCFLVEPNDAEADFGILFLHNEGFSTMCGHGIIAATKVVLETGMLPLAGDAAPVTIDAPAGRVYATAHLVDGVVDEVSFRNVPSFVSELDATVEVPGLGTVRYDLAFGGAFYAFVDAASVGIGCGPAHLGQQVALGRAIKQAVTAARPIEHPASTDLSFLYGVIFTGPASDPAHHSRNVCVFADGEVDRCPTGTGVSARAAIHHARSELALGDWITIESITGSRFAVRALETTSFGPHAAVIPEVRGQAWICGRNELLLDPADAFLTGFFLR